MARDGGPARLCVTNAKGGTGTTTIAINVAGALNELGRDVLFVDLDPQGNATEGLGLLSAYDEPPPSLFDALTGRLAPGKIEGLVDHHAEMDVLTSNVDMLQAEHELTVADLIAKAKDGSIDVDPADVAPVARSIDVDDVGTDHALDRLDAVLSAIDDGYDYVIIDSPPFYGQLTDAGIYAARNVLVPALTEASSERAIELLITQIAALEASGLSGDFAFEDRDWTTLFLEDDDFTLRANDTSHGTHLGPEHLRMTSRNATVYADSEDDDYYVVIDTGRSNADHLDEYNATVGGPLDSASIEFEVGDRDVALDTADDDSTCACILRTTRPSRAKRMWHPGPTSPSPSSRRQTRRRPSSSPGVPGSGPTATSPSRRTSSPTSRMAPSSTSGCVDTGRRYWTGRSPSSRPDTHQHRH